MIANIHRKSGFMTLIKAELIPDSSKNK